uniref:Peptidoglycan-associated lipoprotein n=1 Tax=Chlorobium chlorochromatii (strain CaD3) TaxID=340177 RepID=Q3ARS4_CHLCH
MKRLLRSLFIPATLLLGACCIEDDIVVAPAAVPAPVAVPAPKPTPAPAVVVVPAPVAVVVVAPVPPPLPKPIVLPALVDVFFDFNKSELGTTRNEQLKRNANWIKAHPTSNIIIEGHCDERGTNEYNIALGERRANSAKDYMVTLGVDPARLTTVSYGEEKPVAIGSTEEAWAQNRRVHFIAE